MSDLHLEMRNVVFEFPQKAPILMLAGDVGDPDSDIYKLFLNKQADRFEKVFVCKGNHECYGKSLCQADELIQNICDERDNLIYLNRTSYDLDDDYVILGTTLWSEMSDDERSDIGCFLGDMRHIKDWSFDQNNWQHAKEVSWLKHAIKEVERREKLAVVMTHHCPSFRGTVAPQHIGNSLSTAFCTDLEDLMQLPVSHWICGHTHTSFNLLFNNECRLVSNQRGYPEEKCGFDPEFCIELLDLV